VASCSGSSAPAPTTDTAAPSTAPPSDDGTLLLGAVLPRGGVAPELGVSMRAAVSLAVGEINAAGGVLGQPLQVVVQEEGESAADALVSVQTLVQQGVDAIIGPTSSTTLLGTLGVTVENEVLTCSPTASALSLDDYPDNGLLLRTVPSDSLQAVAIARVVEESGSRNAFVAYLDDAYGRPLANAVETALRANGTSVLGDAGFVAEADSIEAAVATAVASKAELVVVLADGATGPALISAIDDAVEGSPPEYVVNDAMRRPDAAAAPLARNLLSRITGVSPLAYPRSIEFLSSLRSTAPDATGLFATNVYDCVNLIALAAQAAESDNPFTIAASVPSVSEGGQTCRDFSACLEVLQQGRNVDYDGPDGVIALGVEGGAVTATFERFGFDLNGRDVTSGYLVVGND
jgi:branched-chain amino acid transport system substrate-binding protein